MDFLDSAGVISIRPAPAEKFTAADAPPTALQFIAITFHPIRPIVYLATEHIIYVYDLSISGLLGHVRVATNERITHVLSSATHPFMIAAIDSGSLYVWEQNTFALLMVLQTAAKEALDCVQISMTSPVIYYTRPGLREVGTVDILKGPPTKLDLQRKGAQCLAVHPSKPEVACGCADGHVRFWDTAGKVSAGVDDFATTQTAANKNAVVAGISHLAFDPLQHNLIAASNTGLAMIWSLGKTMKVLGSRRLVTGDQSLLSLSFHPRHALFFVLASNGALNSWTYLKAPKDGNTMVSGTLSIMDLGTKEIAARLADTPAYLLPPPLVPANPTSMRQHPKLNYMTFLFPLDANFGGPSHLLQHGMYSLNEDNQSSYAPLTTCYNFPWLPEVNDPVTFVYPSEMYYFAKTNVLNAYLPAYTENLLKKKIPEQDSEGIIVRPLRLLHNPISDRFLILTVPNQQFLTAQQLLTSSHGNSGLNSSLTQAPPATRAVMWHASAPDNFVARAARDACWAVEATDVLVLLSEGGRRADLMPATAEKPLSATELSEPAARVFSTSLPDGVVLYYVQDSNALVYSANVSPQRTKEEPAYSLSKRPGDRFTLLRDEAVLQVNWHASGQLFAVVTSHRVLIFAKDFTRLATYVFPANHTRPFCSSALWAGAALLMATPTHLVYMTVDGTVRTIASLEQPGAVLMSVLNDKVVFATSNRTNTEIRAQPIGLLEALVCGQLAYAAWRQLPQHEVAVHLARIISRFDCTRVSDNVYSALQSAGFPDAAASLLAAAPSPLVPQLYKAAVGSLRFELALSIQKEKKGAELPPLSDLGRACVAYGQFETARRAYELGGDFLALLQLYASCGNRPGVEQLLERAKKDEALKLYVPVVERVLKVRTFTPAPTPLLSNWRMQSSLREYDTTPVTVSAMVTSNRQTPEFVQPVGRLETLDKFVSSLHDRFAGKEPRGPAYLASAPEAVRPTAPSTLPEPVNRAVSRTVSERSVGGAGSSTSLAIGPSSSGGSSTSTPTKESSAVITLAATNATAIPADLPSPSPIRGRSPRPGTSPHVGARTVVIPSGELLTPLRQPPMKRSIKATSSTLSLRRSPSEDELEHLSDSDADAPPPENDDDFSDEEAADDNSSQNEPLPSPKGSDPPSTPQTPKEHSRQPSISSSPAVGTPPSTSTSHSRHSSANPDSPAPSSKHSRQPSVSLEVGKSSPHSGHHRRHSREHKDKEHKDKEHKEKDRESRDSGASTPAALASPTSTSPAPTSPTPLSPRIAPPAAAGVTPADDRPIERSGSSSGGSGIVLKVALLSDETLANLEKDLIPDSANPIKTALLSGLSKLEKGNFASALEDVEESIKLIAASPDAESHKTLARLCVAYKLALKLLIEIKLLEKDPAGDKGRIAVFAKLLSDARLLPKHQVICARMAVNKNMDAGNYGVAARLLHTLIPLQLPDHASHETKLKKCEEENLNDAALPPPYICPSCNASVSVGAAQCPTCSRTPYFCVLSWQILPTKFCHGCVFCGALYHPDLIATGAHCPFCTHGIVDKHSILN